MTACRSCGAAIIWAESMKGQRMPIDADPVDNGNVFLYHDGPKLVAQVLSAQKLGAARAKHVALRISHHATCPHAKNWRR